jgi:hypothetical protein
MSQGNFIPICRDIFEHWIYQDADYLKVWLTMLGRARFSFVPKVDYCQGIKYTQNRSEFLYGRKYWSELTGVGEQRLRTLLKRLIKEEMIVNISTTSKFTIYSIKNYEKFNQHINQQETQAEQRFDGVCQPAEQPDSNQHLTSSQPQKNKVVTKIKNVNKNTYSEFVTLTPAEHERLTTEFGQVAVDRMIEILDNYKGSNGKKYVDDNRAIRNWVIKRYQEEKSKQPEQKQSVADKAREISDRYEQRHGIKTNSGNERSISVVEE